MNIFNLARNCRDAFVSKRLVLSYIAVRVRQVFGNKYRLKSQVAGICLDGVGK